MFQKMMPREARFAPSAAAEFSRESSASGWIAARFGEEGQDLFEKIVANIIVAMAIFFVSFFFTLSVLDFMI